MFELVQHGSGDLGLILRVRWRSKHADKMQTTSGGHGIETSAEDTHVELQEPYVFCMRKFDKSLPFCSPCVEKYE